MKTVTLLEFRKNAQATLEKVAAGQTIVLTRRGRAIARLEPIGEERIGPDDPIYALGELAVEGNSLTNEQMDSAIYGR
jgi:antitoxin (DNA-binding transcriptional repressor) of toxin-antitoxin stability system